MALKKNGEKIPKNVIKARRAASNYGEAVVTRGIVRRALNKKPLKKKKR